MKLFVFMSFMFIDLMYYNKNQKCIKPLKLNMDYCLKFV